MVEFTFFEIHLHDSTFTANAPFSGNTAPEESTSAAGGTGDSSTVDVESEAGPDQSGSHLPLLLGLAVVVGIAVAAQKFLGDDDTTDIEYDAPEEQT